MAGPILWLKTDERMLERIRRGDEAVLADIYHSARKMIIAFVRKNSGSEDDAEDLLQEALIILWERVRADSYEPTAKVTTFLYGIVQNLWLRQLARMRRENTGVINSELAVSGDASPLDELIETEEAHILAEALAKLGDPCRQLLLLYYYEERSMDEIARELGFANSDTAKSKKYQCKKALEKILRRN
jgi:RNA polymerase sigma factor (sigma-70 family)